MWGPEPATFSAWIVVLERLLISLRFLELQKKNGRISIMVSSYANSLLRFVGWSFLPDFATHHILRTCAQVPFLPPAPLPNTSAYITRYRYTFSFVVLAFLLYNLLEASRSMEPNFYELLGVTPQAEEQTLRLAFRQFAKRYHPDKMAKEVNGGDEMFMIIRDAFEALKNPVTRFAYDR